MCVVPNRRRLSAPHIARCRCRLGLGLDYARQQQATPAILYANSRVDGIFASFRPLGRSAAPFRARRVAGRHDLLAVAGEGPPGVLVQWVVAVAAESSILRGRQVSTAVVSHAADDLQRPPPGPAVCDSGSYGGLKGAGRKAKKLHAAGNSFEPPCVGRVRGCGRRVDAGEDFG